MSQMIILGLLTLLISLGIILAAPCHVKQNSIGNAIVDYARSGQQTSYSSGTDQTLSAFFQVVEHELRKQPRYEHQELRRYLTRQVMRLVGATSTMDGDWLYDQASTQLWWSKNGPTVRRAVVRATPTPTKSPLVVVHMRLGDVPFGELHKPNSCYHMQKYAYYEWAFHRLGVLPGSTVWLVYSTRWRSQPSQQIASQAYVDAWKHHFSQKYVIHLQSSDSPLEDFAFMVHAKKFVGSTGTFAFVAGVGRPDDEWCMPMLGREEITGYHLVPHPPPWMSPIPPLLHADVRKAKVDYLNVSAVTTLLV
jgi:hypothetical protein